MRVVIKNQSWKGGVINNQKAEGCCDHGLEIDAGERSRLIPADDGDIYATTRFAIKDSCPFSHVFLMTARKTDMFILTVMSLVPLVLALLFACQLTITLARPSNMKHPTLYTPDGDVYYIEYSIIVIVCVTRLVPRILDLVRVLGEIGLLVSMWQKSKSYGGLFLLAGFTRIFLKLFFLPVVALAMGIFVAFFNSSSVLRVAFNILLFGFLLDLDNALVTEYLKFRYPASHLQVVLMNVRFHGGKDAFWANSEKSEEAVLEALEQANPVDMDPNRVFHLLTSAKKGLGISNMGGTTCKLVISVQKTRHENVLKNPPNKY
eukprot:GEMP01051244.1.p1 GENE.GEMP01051244.1~~GEMP01051244.1.p1  ORF type:complete len:319 (+),score=57.78 GEMP01051244.1:165-1121(+)